MKKFLCLILAVATVFIFIACGNSVKDEIVGTWECSAMNIDEDGIHSKDWLNAYGMEGYTDETITFFNDNTGKIIAGFDNLTYDIKFRITEDDFIEIFLEESNMRDKDVVVNGRYDSEDNQLVLRMGRDVIMYFEKISDA